MRTPDRADSANNAALAPIRPPRFSLGSNPSRGAPHGPRKTHRNPTPHSRHAGYARRRPIVWRTASLMWSRRSRRVHWLYGFRRIRAPVFEQTAVFARALVRARMSSQKEMYTFEDRGGDSVTLRPIHRRHRPRLYHGGWRQYAPLKVATHGPLCSAMSARKGPLSPVPPARCRDIGRGGTAGGRGTVVLRRSVAEGAGGKRRRYADAQHIGRCASREACGGARRAFRGA